MENEKEKQILQYMASLEISREEAEQLYEDDLEDYIGEDGEEMTEKAKKVMRTIHQAESGDGRKGKKVERVRKENPTKREIISEIQNLLMELYGNAEITNPEKYISFQIGSDEFEINLIQKRKPKTK